MTRPITRALLSVSDKTGLLEFAQFLAKSGVEILSTGGTAKALREAGVAVKDVSEHTGFPEIMDGRVKTLHPKIHGGLLGVRDNAEHRAAMEKNAIPPIDLVVVNLYPFEETVAKGAEFDECIENIDIGGPSMLRSAAKNHADVTVVVDPADYAAVTEEMKANKGATTPALRRRLAARAFDRTAAYDGAIAQWFDAQTGREFPSVLTIAAKRRQALRYGENPQQQAAFYVIPNPPPGIATATQLQGKELSYNNINDTDAAFELVSEFEGPACAIIKHANPCGVATGKTLAEAYRKALACDPVSAFGGVIALNRPLDEETAAEIANIFTEVIIAPGADAKAKEIITQKKNLRLLMTGSMPDPARADRMIKMVSGGFLLQNRDNVRIEESDLQAVTKKKPDAEQLRDLLFAFTVCKHVKSNAIIFAKDGAAVGIGAGQMSRIDSTRIAAWKATEAAENAGEKQSRTIGAVMASDAFFPFADNVEAAHAAGISAIIQPGGSVRDAEVIAKADECGIAMVFTARRHFRH
ncbi:MAG: bifunctional phosphoribosylaminoimidazolecarboxamide formyltransferase/IMP cyclohydrolase [Alphaproteobacteria bacterium]|nr:bifunctional phosphoribosylaminoimidazolecarboxamide formyltransferase/IMP cyclohydrolase [Alphaproteobacteria bacterium]